MKPAQPPSDGILIRYRNFEAVANGLRGIIGLVFLVLVLMLVAGAIAGKMLALY